MKNTRIVVAALLSFAAVHSASAGPLRTLSELISGGEIQSDVTVQADKNCVMRHGLSVRIAPDPKSTTASPSFLVTLVPPTSNDKDAAGDTPCEAGKNYQVAATDINSSVRYHDPVIGAALIPFKYYASGDKSVASNASALGYLGERWHSSQGDLIIGFGIGPSTISVPASSSSSSSSSQGSSQATGFTTALMLLGQVGYDSSAQFGIAVGQDRVSSSLNWVNQGKTWVGVQIGVKIY